MTRYTNPRYFTRIFSMAARAPAVLAQSGHRNKSTLRLRRPQSGYGMLLTTGFLCLILMGVILAAPARAASITPPGLVNPPPPLMSTGLAPPEVAIADTARLVDEAGFAATGVLQAVLNVQGFTAANNWSLGPVLPLANNATFNITQYSLCFNVCAGPPPKAGNGFGEDMDFTLNPNLAPPPGCMPPNCTEHWLQILNEDQQYGNPPFGYRIGSLGGFWQADNGDKAGGPAAGAAAGPYYDSNNPGVCPPNCFSTPPDFHDLPAFYLGAGTYLHFDVFPVWDVFTPAAGNAPATESIDVGSVGLSWGFQIVAVPEPSSVFLLTSGGLLIALGRLRSRKRAS